MCIVTVMNHGLRNGGGVGDILRKPSKDVSAPAPPLAQGAGPPPGHGQQGSPVRPFHVPAPLCAPCSRAVTG